MPKRKINGGIVRFYSECVRRGKEQGIRGMELVKFVSECLSQKAEVRKELEEEWK